MTRRLLLLRHGHAASPLGIADIDRPLTGQGRRQCRQVGADCRARGLLPELVVVSPALRARQTWEALAVGMGATPEVDVDRRVYANTVDDLLEVIGELPDELMTVLIVGHNPSIAGLVDVLDNEPQRPARGALSSGYPTGTLAVVELDDPWRRVLPGAGVLREVLSPHTRLGSGPSERR
ncbi:SixA phosphatase family protein [Thermasporomyces composti]|uniref:Phosphohistidine phosphatase n=1 Tax=Thermasporomyces composti TaxID=696763 RepID=A0A3D9VJB9_THECX|nr:histidine phosphatase family protein [Thermasporomyces composti]REF38304.1 phosphohistidine phosphatase [Thermasporomyces composti]